MSLPINVTSNSTAGRRISDRIVDRLAVVLLYQVGESLEFVQNLGISESFNEAGLACELTLPLPESLTSTAIKIKLPDRQIESSAYIVWRENKKRCALRLTRTPDEWADFVKAWRIKNQDHLPIDRRKEKRRKSGEIGNLNSENRRQDRRFSELLKQANDFSLTPDNKKVKTFLRNKSTTFTPEAIRDRRMWLEEQTGVTLSHIREFSENVETFKGKIENPIGVVHMPLGIAGPLKVNGDHAQGTYFVPMATTEGALITSYTLGSHIITRSGGANVKILRDELKVGPMFVFPTLREADAFVKWLKINISLIRTAAENTSKHLKLNEIKTIMDGRRVIVNFHYDTADAMGMNMACKATDVACQKIRSVVRPQEFWLRSNFNANKKVTAQNFINGYGKAVTADVTIPRKLIGLLNTTPEKMGQYFYRTMLADCHAGMMGANGHFANAVAAIFIACGQDVASVANSHVGISTCEVTPQGDLYFSVYVSNLLLGTVGGGTEFGTSAECLNLLGCLGTGKAKRFAEIIASVCLAGEIAICASVVNETYVFAHESFGRNRPKK